MPQDSANSPAVRVTNARTHNLKGVSCRIPHGKLTVVTGPSGAGKSSLAFDTVFAEGQRRFVESMSTYARQFLRQMERPPVDELTGVLPAVALESKNSVRNARSTVGTITETYDVLRLLFAHLGEVECPNGHGAARAWSADDAAADLVAGAAGERFLLVAELPRPKKAASVALRELARQGFRRQLAADGELVDLDSKSVWRSEDDPLRLVLGRFKSATDSPRLTATIEDGYGLAAGRILAFPAGGDGEVRHYQRTLGCVDCGETFLRPTPPLFSYNSPLGACDACKGFGRVIGVDKRRVIPDPRRTLEERPIAPWNTPAYEKHYPKLLAAAEEAGVPTDRPWRELDPEHRAWVWSGKAEGATRFTNLDKFFAWLERKVYRVHLRVLLAKYRSYDPCPDCGGTRLKPEALAVKLQGEILPHLTWQSIERLRDWFSAQDWSARQREVAGHLLDELEERIETLCRVGLGYLTLSRPSRSLSGGETQRIYLAAALGSGLTSTLYVLDEPTIGLHPRDSARLLELLKDLAARGNTVLVVEHDHVMIEGADHIIDLGPDAGTGGGEIIGEGPIEVIRANPDSKTARALNRKPTAASRRHLERFRREQGGAAASQRRTTKSNEPPPRVRIENARAHNLTGIDVEFPLGELVAVAGVSGSGKSTLIENVLWANWRRNALGSTEAPKGGDDIEIGICDGIDGLHHVGFVSHVGQQPLGRSARSNPVTYVKAWDEVRQLFASLPEARERDVKPGHFSFNVDGGRCAECRGTGATEVDMHFMAPISVTCDACDGARFQRHILAIRWQGLNVADVLELTVDEALERFAGNQRLVRKLGPLVEAGLGYLRLGQPTSTLSGGEAQRLKLASFLHRGKKASRGLFLFDEPTTGLHSSDVDLLYTTLRKLVNGGDSVLVIEHNLELLGRADWIIDLGPGGGSHGGRLLYSGPLTRYLDSIESPTADELRRHLAWKAKAVARC